MGTTASGFVYPEPTDAPRVWEDMADLANSIEAKWASLGQWTSFLPTFTAGILAFGTGNSRTGWYTVIGQMCFWNWRIEFGATGTPALNAELQWDIANVGNPYIDASPLAPGLNTNLGTWTHRSNTAGLRHYSGVVGLFAVGGTTAFLGGAYDGTAHRVRMGAATHITAVPLANSDVLSASGAFRIA